MSRARIHRGLGTLGAVGAAVAEERLMGQPYVGEIQLFAGNFAPSGWNFCDGSILAIAQFETLFNLIGTTYGGDGQTTFQLPDLRRRAPINQGTGPGLSGYVVGQSGGSESVTLTTNQMPAHTRYTYSGDRTNNRPANALATGGVYAPASEADATHGMAPSGGSQPHENMPPYLVLTYIISMFGVFPSPA